MDPWHELIAEGTQMDGNDMLRLGIGIQPPRKLASQRLEVDKIPYELHLEVIAAIAVPARLPDLWPALRTTSLNRRGAISTSSSTTVTSTHRLRAWRARDMASGKSMSRTRKGSRFPFLFEQAAMTLVREMPVNAAGCGSCRSPASADTTTSPYSSTCRGAKHKTLPWQGT